MKSWKEIYFKDKKEAKWFSKFRKARKELELGKKGVLTFKRLTVLKFLRGIIKGTFRALLTWGNEGYDVQDKIYRMSWIRNYYNDLQIFIFNFS